jgi:hypothetical protein
MFSAVTFVLTGAVVLAGFGLGWCARQRIAPRYVRRADARRFAREFAELVEGTELDLTALRGPGHGAHDGSASEAATVSEGSARSAGSATSAQAAPPAVEAVYAAFIEPTNDAALLTPKPLSLADQDYYAASWQNVRGEFAASPASGLLLASHLTANLLLNRGLLPADTARPTMLPESWTFPSAHAYREALRISARTDDERVPADELGRALQQFSDFYFEMLTLAAVPE